MHCNQVPCRALEHLEGSMGSPDGPGERLCAHSLSPPTGRIFRTGTGTGTGDLGGTFGNSLPSWTSCQCFQGWLAVLGVLCCAVLSDTRAHRCMRLVGWAVM